MQLWWWKDDDDDDDDSAEMSFLDIKDPKKRDAIVAAYLATKNRIQQRNLNEKAQDLAHSDELKEMFHPIVESTEKSAKTIAKELAPLQEEVKNLSANLLMKDGGVGAKRRKPGAGKLWTRDMGMNALNFYLNHFDKSKLDKYFGIQLAHGDNSLMMGDRAIGVDNESNIHIDNVEYKGTDGLWALIMLASPRKAMYTDEDMHKYRDLAARTHVARHPRGAERLLSRPKTTYKWKTFFAATSTSQPSSSSAPPSSGDDDDGEYDDDDDDDFDDDSLSSAPSPHHGRGVAFLPGDIKGLKSKLNLLLAEFRAGNTTATRGEIVPILDELLRRRQISRGEYNDINRHISAKCL